jgi:ankyrin repeat protein
MPRRNSRKTRKQSGGAASPAGSGQYTQTDINDFFIEIRKLKQKNGTSVGYYANHEILDPKFFELTPGKRHVLQIKLVWKEMVNNCYNSFGQTPLYVALRFNADSEMIDMLLSIIEDVNRANLEGSTPLIGLCFGTGEMEKINFGYVTRMINKLCFNHGADLNLANLYGETPLSILYNKSIKRNIVFTEY